MDTPRRNRPARTAPPRPSRTLRQARRRRTPVRGQARHQTATPHRALLRERRLPPRQVTQHRAPPWRAQVPALRRVPPLRPLPRTQRRRRVHLRHLPPAGTRRPRRRTAPGPGSRPTRQQRVSPQQRRRTALTPGCRQRRTACPAGSLRAPPHRTPRSSIRRPTTPPSSTTDHHRPAPTSGGAGRSGHRMLRNQGEPHVRDDRYRCPY